MARAMWKGQLVVGEERIPVKLYAAAEDRAVHFRLLARRSLNPVAQRMVSSRTGKEVASEKVRKGYPTEDGRFVILDEEELAALEPEPSREIRLSRFVPPEAIDPAWYDRPYYLGPDGDQTAYAAMAGALAAEEQVGVAHWVMRRKSYAGALRLEGGRLLLVTLRRAGEVVPAAALPSPGGREPEPQELRMAEQLVEALAGDFDPAAYGDEYRERVRAFVKAKAQGKSLKLKDFQKEPAADGELAARLEESLAAARAA